MEGKIRILFYNLDSAGVNYFRSLTPAMELERNHSDEFYVEINSQIDFNDPNYVDYLKSFHIIHYHRQFLPDTRQMSLLANELRKNGTVLICDIDDYWELNKKHPFYGLSKEKKLHIPIIENLKIADYITTTTDLFANEICKVTGKSRDKVGVFYNSVDPTWMKQFQNNWKPDPDGRVRITYAAGSCYDDKTEILTEDGWKLFSNLNKTEKVATINPQTYELEYQQPEGYIDEYYEGDMYYGINNNIDVAITPNHNMFISKVKNSNRKKPFKYELSKMENLDDYDLIFKKNCIWRGKNEEYFILEKYQSKLKTFNDVKFKMEDWLMFFGFWLGDGWTTSDGTNQVGICGFKEKGINKMKEIEQMFISYGYNPTWTKDKKQLRIFNQQLWNYLSQFGKAYDKFIPKHIKNLPTDKLKILFDSYMITDGHERLNGRKTSYTISPKLASDFSEIALKMGTCATVKNIPIKKSSFIKKDNNGNILEIRDVNGKYTSYSVNYYSITGKKDQIESTVLRKKIKKEKYVGRIYCVTVPNHTLYVRRNGKSYWCGNSHLGDIEQLDGVFNVLSSDPDLKDKFKVIIAGWDTEGSTTEVTFNQEFGAELQQRNLWTPEIIKAINKSKGDVDTIPIPLELKNKYRGNIFNTQQRDIKSEESVYLYYENILTNNHKMITNEDYLNWLNNFERNVKYENEGNFARRWTQKANSYAAVLDETDIVIAPLADNKFNNFKSNLKQVECWTRKLPIVCSDIPPYNVHGKHMENCVLIPVKSNSHKYWHKYLKRLILDADLRKQLGEKLYEDFKIDYNLAEVTKKRAEYYKKAVAKTLELV